MKRKKRNQTDKVMCCRKHFKKRVKERLGLSINRFDIKQLCENIKKRIDVISWREQSNRVICYNMIFLTKRCIIVFDDIRKTPITVLTMSMWNE